MTNTTFSFYPAVREGYRPGTDATFQRGATTVDNPGTTRVDLELTATGGDSERRTTAGVDLTIYGPGEVTAVDSKQVVREEPSPRTTSFPPAYFPLIEFDSPQLPWVFSPERADDNGRLRPWLCLVVVPTDRVTFEPGGDRPSPVLETTTDQLPDASQTWAWAHAQVVGSHTPENAFGSDSTATRSRLLCPRNLDAETTYRACVVPTFEPGRRAGLGLEPFPDGRSEIALAWTDEDAVRLPVYHTWEFTTARGGTFESLVEELEPVQLGGRGVGYREVDVSDPGPPQLKLPDDPSTGQGTVTVGGALTAVGTEPNPYDESASATLRTLLNQPDRVEQATTYGAVGPPLYGQYHAGVARLEPPTVDGPDYYYPPWFDTLNTDPRHRLAASYGAAVVRNEQQRLVTAAWDQFGEIEEANRYLRRAQLAEAVLATRHDSLSSYPAGTLLGVTEPLHGTLLDGEASGKTVRGRIRNSDLPQPLLSPSFRGLTRPTGPLARGAGSVLSLDRLGLRLQTGRIPQLTDGIAPTTETVGEAASGSPGDTVSAGSSPSVPVDGELPSQRRSTAPDVGSTPSANERDSDTDAVLTALDSLDAHVRRAERSLDALSTAVDHDDAETVRTLLGESPTVVEQCESVGRNTLDPLSRAVTKLLAEPRPASLPASFDSAAATRHLQSLHEARRQLEGAVGSLASTLSRGQSSGGGRRQSTVTAQFDSAQSALSELTATSRQLRAAVTGQSSGGTDRQETGAGTVPLDGSVSELSPIGSGALSTVDIARPAQLDVPDTSSLRSSVLAGLDPRRRYPKLAAEVTGIETLPQREDPVEEVLAAPSFDEPASKLLAALDQEHFLPGVGDVPRDSVGVLETNPEFVEAFLTGFNHEFARELQWRNYPTDRRGSYLRQFWDRSIDDQTSEGNPESTADIPPIHTWDENDLGENSRGADSGSVVLLVRGELLRRYPNTTIFAAKAVAEEAETGGDGTGGDGATPNDEALDRVPALPDTPVTRGNRRDDVRFPTFRGTLDPDVTYFGFDLTPEEALYDPYHEAATKEPDNRADEGWFFVFQEPPAETRFGLDETDGASVPRPPGVVSDGATRRRSPDSAPATQSDSNSSSGRTAGGWSDLTWAHVTPDGTQPDDVRYVDIDDSQPGRENWAVRAGDTPSRGPGGERFTSHDAATWGFNSAHMARITWQLPVRVSVHADDMLPDEPSTDDGDWRTVFLDHPAPGGDR